MCDHSENLSQETENGFESFLNCPKCGCENDTPSPLTERPIGQRIRANPNPVINAVENYFNDLFGSN